MTPLPARARMIAHALLLACAIACSACARKPPEALRSRTICDHLLPTLEAQGLTPAPGQLAVLTLGNNGIEKVRTVPLSPSLRDAFHTMRDNPRWLRGRMDSHIVAVLCEPDGSVECATYRILGHDGATSQPGYPAALVLREILDPKPPDEDCEELAAEHALAPGQMLLMESLDREIVHSKLLPATYPLLADFHVWRENPYPAIRVCFGQPFPWFEAVLRDEQGHVSCASGAVLYEDPFWRRGDAGFMAAHRLWLVMRSPPPIEDDAEAPLP